VRGASTRWKDATPDGAVELLTAGLGRITDLDKRNYTLTVESGLSVHSLHRELESQGVFVRLPKTGGTVGGLLATRPWAGLREDILGMRVLLSNGEVIELGGKVVKNVAGYDLARFLLGSWGAFAVILEVTMKLHARPVAAGEPASPAAPPKLSPWALKIREAFDPSGRLNPWLTR
jgi:D-lactate dehydrogenase (cytochrome)